MRYHILIAALLASRVTARIMQRNFGPSYIFSFGDSYTSSKFNISNEQPSAEQPLGNDDRPGDSSSQGDVWIEYLTKVYNTSEVLTYNFAVGAASITDNFTYQVQELYQPKYSEATFWKPTNTLFTCWAGVNDIINAWLVKDVTRIPAALDMFEARLEELWNTGARNFLIINTPPLDRDPYIQATDSDSQTHYAEMVKAFNDHLPVHVTSFRNKHPESVVQYYDVRALIEKILDFPQEYGYKDNICMDKDGCIWSGFVHIRYTLHDLIAQEIAKLVARIEFSEPVRHAKKYEMPA